MLAISNTRQWTGRPFQWFLFAEKNPDFSPIFKKFTISLIRFYFRNSSQVKFHLWFALERKHIPGVNVWRRIKLAYVDSRPSLCVALFEQLLIYIFCSLLFSLELKKSIDNTSASVVITRITFTLILAKPLLQSLCRYRQH